MSRLLILATGLVLIISLAARGDEKSAGISLDDIEQLEKQLGSLGGVEYVESPLSYVVDDLVDRRQLRVLLDKPALKAKGLSEESLITTGSFHNVPLGSALTAALYPHGLTWVIHSQMLMITTLDAEPRYALTKVYPVGDIEMELDSLKTFIQTNVAPESWRVYGGASGNVTPHPETKSLVVIATARNHWQIAKLLDTLRSYKKPKAG